MLSLDFLDLEPDLASALSSLILQHQLPSEFLVGKKTVASRECLSPTCGQKRGKAA